MKVLCICTGNRFRSPLLAHIIKRMRPDWEVRSAGTHASKPGVDVPGTWRKCTMGWTEPHTARKVTPEDVAWADVVVGVQQSHVQPLAKHMIVHRLTDPAFRPVADWAALAEELEKGLPALLARLEACYVTPVGERGGPAPGTP